MTADGTAMYDALPAGTVPEMVERAVALARQFEFPWTVHPSTGRLLSLLAAGLSNGLIGETGTGTGAGVAWMAAAAQPGTRIVSVELDKARAEATAELFAGHPQITIVCGDANDLASYGPFDLLVLDAPTTPGPLDWATLDPALQLRPNGLLVKDDLWPMSTWPPKTFEGADDAQRLRWFEHPGLFTTEVTVAEGYAVQIARRRP